MPVLAWCLRPDLSETLKRWAREKLDRLRYIQHHLANDRTNTRERLDARYLLQATFNDLPNPIGPSGHVRAYSSDEDRKIRNFAAQLDDLSDEVEARIGASPTFRARLERLKQQFMILGETAVVALNQGVSFQRAFDDRVRVDSLNDHLRDLQQWVVARNGATTQGLTLTRNNMNARVLEVQAYEAELRRPDRVATTVNARLDRFKRVIRRFSSQND